MRRLLLTLLVLAATGNAADCLFAQERIGYTEFRTNLPGGRHANVSTMQAMVVQVDGSGRRSLGKELADKPDTWTQFAGWSPDGKTAIIGRGWQSPDNAKWEEEHKQFRFTKEGWLLDSYLVDLASGKAENVTAIERVSFYNGGLFFWPNDPAKLGFTALIDGNSHPFRMDRDGRNKIDLTKGSKEFAYGFSQLAHERQADRVPQELPGVPRGCRDSSRRPAAWRAPASRSTSRRPGRQTASGFSSSRVSITTAIRTSSAPMGQA